MFEHRIRQIEKKMAGLPESQETVPELDSRCVAQGCLRIVGEEIVITIHPFEVECFNPAVGKEWSCRNRGNHV